MHTGSGQEKNDADSDSLTSLYLIRHAEKDLSQGKDPGLTRKGQQRAKAWVNYFFLKEVDHVLSSDFNRTRQTAKALAEAQGLEIEIYDVSTLTGKAILERYRGKTVVVFGHSNTIHNYANDLQDDVNYPELNESDYDTFFVVRVDNNGNSSATKESMDFMD